MFYIFYFPENQNTNVDFEIFKHFVILCTCNEGHHFYLNDMQANYVMEYLNDYNENAKMLVCLNLLFS